MEVEICNFQISNYLFRYPNGDGTMKVVKIVLRTGQGQEAQHPFLPKSWPQCKLPSLGAPRSYYWEHGQPSCCPQPCCFMAQPSLTSAETFGTCGVTPVSTGPVLQPPLGLEVISSCRGMPCKQPPREGAAASSCAVPSWTCGTSEQAQRQQTQSSE